MLEGSRRSAILAVTSRDAERMQACHGKRVGSALDTPSQTGTAVIFLSSSLIREHLTTCAGVTAGRHNGSRHVTATRGLNRPSAPEARTELSRGRRVTTRAMGQRQCRLASHSLRVRLRTHATVVRWIPADEYSGQEE